MLTLINIFLIILKVYFGIGFLFGIYFLLKGSKKIDPIIAKSQRKVRLLILPGIIATWPFLLSKLFKPKTVSS